MFTLWVVWGVLTTFVLSLALIRKFASKDEMDLVHLSGAPDREITKQFSFARTLDKIDHWGKLLTAIDIAFGVVLAAVALYSAWLQSIALDK